MNTLEQLNFRNTYRELPEIFHSAHQPQPLKNAFLIHANPVVAQLLGLNTDELKREDFLDIVSGKKNLPGMSPLAMCYAGHQFGHLVPRLGDGRAILLGQIETDDTNIEETKIKEKKTSEKNKWDLQLKGAGQTLYSRGSDGRVVLRSSIREYLCSAAMHGLGIASSHALFLSGSEHEVYREQIETGAMIMRVAPSHIRFGTFEYFYYSQRLDDLKILFEYVIEQHYPQLKTAENPCLEFFEQVTHDTAAMIANWQAVGFAHGVMNTDNMSIHGITLDYGPFGFLDAYEPGFICNHSDHQGRYAFDKQPEIGLFNLSCLAQALLPLFDDDTEAGVQLAKSVLDSYQTLYTEKYAKLMRAKLGLLKQENEDQNLVNDLLALLEKNKIDYTIFFRQLSEQQTNVHLVSLRDMFIEREAYDVWLLNYQARLECEETTLSQRSKQMKLVNPKYILRNYLAEIAIRAAEDEKDYTHIEQLMRVLQNPFDEHDAFDSYAAQPPDWAQKISVSCSS